MSQPVCRCGRPAVVILQLIGPGPECELRPEQPVCRRCLWSLGKRRKEPGDALLLLPLMPDA